MTGGAAKCTVGGVLGNGGGNCIGAATGRPEIGPENGAGNVIDEDCSFDKGTRLAACNEVLCKSCGAPAGKWEEGFAIPAILLSIFIEVLLGGNCKCP